ncbi:hypothetical protein [Flavobacterium sp.]|uniref:hypothetical protein n=1 Tax=Flavobacterium sp. TaxID=239 RepID=UPI00286A8283|nr:hypothetical protein [Flavobacterium sp.]
MKNLFCFSFLIFSSIFNSFSQKLEEDFNLSVPEKKVKSLYSKLIVIDARKDTTNMGIIQKGAFNRKAFLKPKIALKTQIETVFNKMIEDNSGNNELVLNVRDFKFAEVTGAFEENGYCYFRADLFLKKDNFCQKIDSIDTVIKVGAMDVTQKNIRTGSEKLIDFLSKNLNSIKSGPTYSFEDIKNLEFLEKRKIPIYNTKEYVTGIYTFFDSFKNQKNPITDYTITRNKKGKITKLTQNFKDGSKFELNSSNVYAIVESGKILISTSYGYYPLEFKDDDFYFTGKAKVTANTGDVVLATAFFGIIGGLIASENAADFQMKIDYLNGAAIQIKQISN